MSIQATGYLGLGWSAILATAVTDNLLVIGAGLGMLVAVSTLLIRLFIVVDNRIEKVIHQMQANGDLPMKLERQETQRTLEQVVEKLDRLLDY